LKVAAGAPVWGVLGKADRMSARVQFDGLFGFEVTGLELPCSNVSLDHRNEMREDSRPRPDGHAVAEGPPTRGERIGLLWGATDVVFRASPTAPDGLRLGRVPPFGFAGASWFQVLERTPGSVRVKATTPAGSELVGWVDASIVVSDSSFGAGRGTATCAGTGSDPAATDRVTLRSGAPIHLSPGGPRWGAVPGTSLSVDVDRDSRGQGWRRIVHVDALAEPGDPCSPELLEHAYVSAADVRP
jgi:hypothetical protein